MVLISLAHARGSVSGMNFYFLSEQRAGGLMKIKYFGGGS